MNKEEFKVGDLVMMETRIKKAIGRVEEITPAGNVRFNGSLYSPQGKLKGAGKWDNDFIRKITEEEANLFRRKVLTDKYRKILINYISNSNIEIPLEDVISIGKILKIGEIK